MAAVQKLGALLVVMMASTIAVPAAADLFRPAYLEMTQTDDTRYDVRWRAPVLPGARRPTARPVWPAGVQIIGAPRSVPADGSREECYTVEAEGGLVGRSIAVEGALGGATDVIVRIRRLDGTTQLERLTPADARFTVTASPGPGEVATAYFVLGVEHILGGLDHLLFVLALLLLVRSLRRLVLTITAFTVAHSATLVCATLGWLRLPGPPVEAIIALSIVFVAAEVIHEQQGRPSLTARSPWVVAFAFGLLHGLGFAGALQEIGLPEQAIPVALVTFNVGVEVGQLLFVAALVSAALVAARLKPLPFPVVSRGISYAIGSVAAFWTIERVAAFI